MVGGFCNFGSRPHTVQVGVEFGNCIRLGVYLREAMYSGLANTESRHCSDSGFSVSHV